MSLSGRRAFVFGWLRLAATRSIAARALKIAAVVGSILNVVNQGDAIFGEKDINWIRICFTFMVPYCVSTLSAVEAIRSRDKERA